jgi:predicted site-specific integrase-resolvase
MGFVKVAGPLNTASAAKALGVSKATLLRWIRNRKTEDVARDRHNWRVFTATDIRRIKKDIGIGG